MKLANFSLGGECLGYESEGTTITAENSAHRNSRHGRQVMQTTQSCAMVLSHAVNERFLRPRGNRLAQYRWP